MISYIIRRLIYLIIVLIIVSIAIFLIMALVPGDPATVSLGTRATPELIAQRRTAWGLDRPIFVRYYDWIKNALKGDLGNSFYLNRPVIKVIKEKMPVTLLLAVNGLIISILIGIPLGILAAMSHRTTIDKFCIIFGTLGNSIPGFWLGLNMAFIFGVILHWFPTGGYVSLLEDFFIGVKHIILPSFSIGLINAAIFARITRSAMLDVMNEQFIQVTRAKGLNEITIILKHALRNILLPIITISGTIFASLVGGAVVIETVFTIPGLSSTLLIAVNRRDFVLLQGIILVIAFIFVTINLIVDILYAFIDPRVKLY